MMLRKTLTIACTAAIGALATHAAPAGAEILAFINYESKPAEALRSFRSPVAGMTRSEGLAVIDVDPASPGFGAIKQRIELPPDLIAHHIFFNRDMSKAYLTALGKPELRVIDMRDPALAMKTVAVPDCIVGEDIVFSGDNRTWYLSCMGSSKIIVGDATSDRTRMAIDMPVPYPHGLAVHDGIDRLLVTSTVRATDLGDAGDSIAVIEASTGKVLGAKRVSGKPAPAGEAPVEILFVPGANPPVAYITNMYGNSLWTATWNQETRDFDMAEAWSFASMDVAVPLEMYFDDDATTLYVTTAKPGHLHEFDITQHPARPRLVRSVQAAEGAHHVAFTRDMRMGFVQNSLLNLPGMSDGAITVVDLASGKAIASVDTLKNEGFNPNSIVLMPQWNHLAGH